MGGNIELTRALGAAVADTVGVKLRTEILFLHPNAISPDPDQPRQEFDEGGLARLAESLLKYGQLQPVLVRKERAGYVIVAGERRWRAAKLAGMHTVQALLCKGGDVRSVQLVENLLREDLKPVEQARAYKAIMDKEKWSARELARQLSLEHTGVARALKLLNVAPEIQEAVDAGKIPHTTAYEISRQPAEKQIPLARAAIAGALKGDDLRKKPAPAKAAPAKAAPALKLAPGLTLGASPWDAWVFQAGRVKIEVSGHKDNAALVAALERALDAALDGKKSLAGGVGKR